SPLGDFSLTLFTKSLKTFLNAFKPSVRSFKNDLVLLYIELISFVKSFIWPFNVLFCCDRSLCLLAFSLYFFIRPLYFFFTISFSFFTCLCCWLTSVFIKLLTKRFNL